MALRESFKHSKESYNVVAFNNFKFFDIHHSGAGRFLEK